MARYRVQGPDGAVHVFEGPDDASPQQVEAFAAQTFGGQSKEPAKPAMLPAQRALGNLAAGAVRGAGSIGATILAPVDMVRDALDGKGLSLESNRQRRQDMDGALQSLGAEPDSAWYGGGKLVGELAGTMGAGGVLANGMARIPALASKAPALIEAVRTGGMSAAGMTGKAGMGVRMAGGALAGGVSAGMVDPTDAGTGAAVGGALPPVLAGAGKIGQAVGGAVRAATQGPQARSGNDLIRALDLQSPQAVQAAVQKLRDAGELVPGSRPTAAQALQTPQAGILQRVVHDSGGGGALRDQLAAQNAARLAALEGVAPTAPGGYATARQDMGQAIADYAGPERRAAKAATRAAYESVPQDEAALYLPELSTVRDKFFGAGSFVDRGPADKAVQVAQQIGTEQVDGIVPVMAGSRQPKTLAQAVRSAGGLNLARNEGRAGELVGLRGDMKNLVFNERGLTPNRMAEQMHEAGYIPENSIDALIDALKSDARSGPQFSTRDLPEKAWMAAREAEMGAPPAAGAVPKKVTLGEFDNLRKSIGEEARTAAKEGKSTLAAALQDMKTALDDRINEVVRGDGAIDENLPIAWADALDRARALKLQEVKRFGTGPQRDIFRTGSDGQPVVQGGEVAAKFWGNRPGVAQDVDSFRRLIEDNPRLLNQFRSMVTTEGAGTAGMDGKLAGKFAKWVDAMKPGISRAFDPEQADLLQRIAADIRRQESAASAGMARGSNTYQNAQNALNLGLLDNPLLGAAANRVPVVNNVAGPALNWMRESAREAKGRRLAGVLSDSGSAADALELAGFRRPGAAQRMTANPALASLFYRGAPVALGTAGDR